MKLATLSCGVLLLSRQDFEKRGVFDAQVTLERSHRREEDALYRQIFEARDAHVRALEQRIAAEKRRTVAALVAWFEQEGWGGREREAGMVQVGGADGRAAPPDAVLSKR